MTKEQQELVDQLRYRPVGTTAAQMREAATTIEQLAERCGRLEGEIAEAEEVRDATIKVRDDVLMELESWKVRHQDEVNARVNAENDLYAMSQERRREHDLRVKINNEAETLRDAHRIAVDRHSVTLSGLTAARSALTAERTRRGALEARIRKLEACVLEYWHAKDWAAVGAADSTAAKLLPADMKARAALKEGK